jgi:YVTN family beta-propeller protein
MKVRLLFAAFVLSLVPLAAPAAEPSEKVKQKLYVTNSTGDDVTVIDVATNKAIGRIEVGPHPHGIAVPAAQNFILVTIEGKKPGELVWIDPKTDKVIDKMEIGPAPNQLAVTPDGKFAYIPVSDGNYEVVDLAKKKIVERIFTGGRPHNTLCSPDGKHMYLAPMGAPKKVSIVETATHKVVGEIPFTSVVRPIALTKDEKRLFAEVDGLVGIEMADIASRKMVQRVPSELTDEQKKVDSRSHGLAIRPDQKEIWACDVHHSEVQVFDITGDKPKQIAKIAMSQNVYWLTFSPDGKTAYVSVLGNNEVAVVDTETKKITATVKVGKEPKRLLVVSVGDEKGAFDKWEKDIAAFEKQDQDKPPPQNGVVFVGSSSIRRWDLSKNFDNKDFINRGYGGSQLADSVHFADRLVIKHKPRLVVLYAGDNDLAAGKKPEQVADNFKEFVKVVHKDLPKTKIIYISIKPSIARWKLIDTIRKTNSLIEAQCKGGDGLTYLDVGMSMLGDDGMPKKELFVSDGLHLTDEGYKLWAALLKPYLK